MQQVAPHREEPLLDGNAHPVRYGEMIHDGSGKPEKLKHKEEADSEICKVNVSCTSYSRTFTIHKWQRQTAYIFTHNLNNLEHIANNGMNTTKHTNVYNAQF